MLDRAVLVTRKTELTGLVERFGTIDQARYYIESVGGSFTAYKRTHDRYVQALQTLRKSFPSNVRLAEIEKDFIATYTFDPSCLVVTLGQDGLVINVAKYLQLQPILPFNPDPSQIAGVLSIHHTAQSKPLIKAALNSGMHGAGITLASAELNNGQVLVAANDLFVGPRSHGSARYEISFKQGTEIQSSSGIIISTGVGSSGWYSSIVTGAFEVVRALGVTVPPVEASEHRFAWDSPQLRFNVREPFPSRSSAASIVCGTITRGAPLKLKSLMPTGGVIFSDGIESDFIEFNAGAHAQIKVCDRQARILVGLA
ncbi:MAG: sugar kinase [Fimbriimonadaceae bacterium]